MRLVICVTLLGLLATPALADQHRNRLRIADATTDACLANCATQNASCQRVCPTTLATPCISSCQAQAQTCVQSCRRQ